MRDRYEPRNDPVPWSPFPPDRAARDPYLDWDDPPTEVRAAGLRRLSRLTWRATQLGAIATVGFATLFARTAPAQTVSTPAAKPTVKASTAAPSPSPSPAKTHRRHHHRHHHPRPVAAAPAPAPSSAGGPAPAPPTTAPAAPNPPPPSAAPSPSHTSSGGSHGGG
jgi:hypothetical protein